MKRQSRRVPSGGGKTAPLQTVGHRLIYKATSGILEDNLAQRISYRQYNPPEQKTYSIKPPWWSEFV
jgi:hypothetical protein